MTPLLHRAGKRMHFQWNVDCSVGKGGANSLAADVSYIQWYYTLAAQHPLTTPDRKAIYQSVRVTGGCQGTDADPLVAAIVAHQKGLAHGHVDGRVSVATGSGMLGEQAFFVLRIGARLADMYPGAWPRLDLIPGCPASVAQEVRAAIPSIPR
jgi:hypothetical protein